MNKQRVETSIYLVSKKRRLIFKLFVCFKPENLCKKFMPKEISCWKWAFSHIMIISCRHHEVSFHKLKPSKSTNNTANSEKNKGGFPSVWSQSWWEWCTIVFWWWYVLYIISEPLISEWMHEQSDDACRAVIDFQYYSLDNEQRKSSITGNKINRHQWASHVSCQSFPNCSFDYGEHSRKPLLTSWRWDWERLRGLPKKEWSFCS